MKRSLPNYWVGWKIRDLSQKLARTDPWSFKWLPLYAAIGNLIVFLQWGPNTLGPTPKYWKVNEKMKPAATVNEDRGEVERREHDPSYDEARDG